MRSLLALALLLPCIASAGPLETVGRRLSGKERAAFGHYLEGEMTAIEFRDQLIRSGAVTPEKEDPELIAALAPEFSRRDTQTQADKLIELAMVLSSPELSSRFAPRDIEELKKGAAAAFPNVETLRSRVLEIADELGSQRPAQEILPPSDKPLELAGRGAASLKLLPAPRGEQGKSGMILTRSLKDPTFQADMIPYGSGRKESLLMPSGRVVLGRKYLDAEHTLESPDPLIWDVDTDRVINLSDFYRRKEVQVGNPIVLRTRKAIARRSWDYPEPTPIENVLTTSPDGRFAILQEVAPQGALSNFVRLDTQTGQRQFLFRSPPDRIPRGYGASRNGRFFAYVWMSNGHWKTVSHFQPHRFDEQVWEGTDEALVQLYDLEKGGDPVQHRIVLPKDHRANNLSLYVSDDGNAIATNLGWGADKEWHTAMWRLKRPKRTTAKSRSRAVAARDQILDAGPVQIVLGSFHSFSKDAEKLVTGTRKNGVLFYQWDGKKMQWFDLREQFKIWEPLFQQSYWQHINVQDAQITPDGKFLVAQIEYQTSILLDAKPMQKGEVRVTGSTDHRERHVFVRWNLEKFGRKPEVFNAPFDYSPMSGQAVFALYPDGRFIVAGAPPRELILWSPDAGEPVRIPRGKPTDTGWSNIVNLRFSAAGDRLGVQTMDGIRVFELAGLVDRMTKGPVTPF